MESYVAGRLAPERLVIMLATAYYGPTASAGGRRRREGLRPLIDVIDRASPGIVELGSVGDSPGFAIRLAVRPFPERFEAELRRAAETYLDGAGSGAPRRAPRVGVVGRVLGAIRRLLSASA